MGYWRVLYRNGPTIGHLTVGEYYVMGVSLFLFAFIVSSLEMGWKAEGRWRGTSPCDSERIIALRTCALRVYEGKSSELIPPGPRLRIGTTHLNRVSSAYCPNATYLLFGGREALCCYCYCGSPGENNGRFYSSGRSANAGRWRSPPCKMGMPEMWRPSRWLAEACRQGGY